MLQKGFLQRAVDWVHDEFDVRPADLEKAMKVFGLHTLMKKAANPEQLIGLFSEWLLYDVTSPLFKKMTGLDYFVQYNPLNLDKALLQSYRDLLTYKVGYFEVIAVFPGERVVLEDMHGETYDVFDVSASLSTQVKTTLWTRVAKVDGVYQMVGSWGFVLPMVMGTHAKKYGAADEYIDAKAAAEFMCTSQNVPADLKTHDSIIRANPTVADVRKAAQKFDEALAAAGVEAAVQ